MSFTDLIVGSQSDTPADVYISGALQGSRDLGHAKVLYQHAARVFQDAGVDVYVPHQHLAATPADARLMSPEEVFDRDAFHLLGARLVVAFIHEHSTGVGSELAMAVTHEIPTVALHHNGLAPSRFTEGLLRRANIAIYSYRDPWRELPELLSSFATALATSEALVA